jgi:hypothetical protein
VPAILHTSPWWVHTLVCHGGSLECHPGCVGAVPVVPGHHPCSLSQFSPSLLSQAWCSWAILDVPAFSSSLSLWQWSGVVVDVVAVVDVVEMVDVVVVVDMVVVVDVVVVVVSSLLSPAVGFPSGVLSSLCGCLCSCTPFHPASSCSQQQWQVLDHVILSLSSSSSLVSSP